MISNALYIVFEIQLIYWKENMEIDLNLKVGNNRSNSYFSDATVYTNR